MKRPTHVVIGGLSYKIRYEDWNDSRELDEGVFGCILYQDLEIYIADNVSENAKSMALLHEMVHGVYSVMGKEVNENRVLTFSHLLHAALKSINYKAV